MSIDKKKHKIFVEGKQGTKSLDKPFVEALLTHIAGNKLWEKNITLKAVGGYKQLALQNVLMEETLAYKCKNYIVFDTDSLEKCPNDGGKEGRLRYIEEQLKIMKVEAKTFLLPNNGSDGYIETILENIAPKKHQGLLECFKEYEKCISKYKDKKEESGEEVEVIRYQLPITKAKMYSYVDAFKKSEPQNEEFKRGSYFFENPEYWDLDCEYLSPLKDFLQAILDEPIPN